LVVVVIGGRGGGVALETTTAFLCWCSVIEDRRALIHDTIIQHLWANALISTAHSLIRLYHIESIILEA